MNLAMIQWLLILGAILGVGAILGHVIYVGGGRLLDMLDDCVEHGDE